MMQAPNCAGSSRACLGVLHLELMVQYHFYTVSMTAPGTVDGGGQRPIEAVFVNMPVNVAPNVSCLAGAPPLLSRADSDTWEYTKAF